jgi:hypothetical protein
VLELVNSELKEEHLVRWLAKKFPDMVVVGKRADAEDLDEVRSFLREAWEETGYERYALLGGVQCFALSCHRTRPGQSKTAHWDDCPEWFNVYLAIVQLFSLIEKMAVCDNPECCTPYFITSRRGQRFCSEKCSGEGDREAKKKWWREHGEEWRREWKAARQKFYEEKRREKR